MAEFIVHGVIEGHECSLCEKSLQNFVGGFYCGAKGIQKDVRRLVGNRMAYSYLVYGDDNRKFLSYIGRAGSYFGMTLVLNDMQVANPDMLFKVLEATYNSYVKDKVIQDKASGPRKWLCSTLCDSKDTVANYILKGFKSIMDSNPGLVKYQPLPPLPRQERGY